MYSQGHERPEFDFCPLCLLAIPFPSQQHSYFNPCCMKLVCNGCRLAAKKQGSFDACPFCRTTTPSTNEEIITLIQRRVAARDPEAIRQLGDLYFKGVIGLDKDMSRGIELWSEAAELGSNNALFNLGDVYNHGESAGVALDKTKGIRYWEKAAMQGHVNSRHNLGKVELIAGNFDRAVRHFLISAKMGFKQSLDGIRMMVAEGYARKAQYAEALAGYQDAEEGMKSPQRDEAVRLGLTGRVHTERMFKNLD